MRSLIVLLAGLVTMPALAAGDAAAGRGGFGICEACHGVQAEGSREFGAPRIAGIEPWYLQRQLAAFRGGLRGAHPADERGQQMSVIARAVDGEQVLADIGAYLGTLAPPPAPPSLAGDVGRGRRLYESCVPCHGAEARGSAELGAPALRARDDWYLLGQLAAFRNGWRGVVPGDSWGEQMRVLALALPDEQAQRDVVAYVVTMQ
jgi:cytochrome c oxidase subunit 2